MSKPGKDEIVSLALALEEAASEGSTVGPKGLRFMCKEAAKMIRKLRPDLAFVEEPMPRLARTDQ